MTKELNALKEIRLTIKRLCNECYENTRYELEYSKQLDIIETTLKRLEEYDKTEYSALIERHKELLKEKKTNKKKLKAFEIIKRHPFAFASLAMFLEDYNTYGEWEKINPNCFTKEEYELLKEVLL